jgi:uncharacterized protein YukE
MTELAVELSDLGAWATQVNRASNSCTVVGSYASGHVADGDFGAILELITPEYEAMIPQFHSILSADAERLGLVGGTLRDLQADFRETDSRVAQDFGVGAAITDDGDGSGFADAASATPVPAPSAGGEQLPEVSFGWALDKVCDLLSYIGGPDPREYVTKWIAGDIDKAALQASAWEHAADCVKIVESNLAAGAARIAQTWKGEAAVSASAHMDQWVTALADQSTGMGQMAGHLRDMITQAVNMAQVVVDIIKTVISLATAALSSAYIPAWGQWKLIKTAKEALELINNARKVIMVFWNALNMIKSAIVMIVQAFSIDALPPAPTAPAV